jgi:isocitrate dehydrogenase kinase/phosphatase
MPATPPADAARAYAIALAMREGFDRHYRLFRDTSAAAKQRFESADWHGQQKAQRDRIAFYDLRVDEAVERLRAEFQVDEMSVDIWQQVKLQYIGLLIEHNQPELAETFFNSVSVKLLHHRYFNNDFIFVRPAVSTEYIENDEPASLPTYRAYYPVPETLRETWLRIVHNFRLARDFEDLERDIDDVTAATRAELGAFKPRANFQIQVLSSLFYRNKGAYVVGKIINGFTETPFALPIVHVDAGPQAASSPPPEGGGRPAEPERPGPRAG